MMGSIATFIAAAALAVLAVVVVLRTVVIVPQQKAYIVETFGRYTVTLQPGLHVLIPFVQRIAYRHTLKEQTLAMESQECITADNVRVSVSGVLYLQVIDAEAASYGVADYDYGIAQLVQTTLRSKFGGTVLDETLRNRDTINTDVVTQVDEATSPWGVKVLRYEISDITPPTDVQEAMEKQVRAEREKRARILQSEGEQQATINVAEGERQAVVLASEARRDQQINEANGQANAIEAVATATANGVRTVAEAVEQPGGENAIRLRMGEQWIHQFGAVIGKSNTIVLPANMADIASILTLARNVIAAAGPASEPESLTSATASMPARTR